MQLSLLVLFSLLPFYCNSAYQRPRYPPYPKPYYNIPKKYPAPVQYMPRPQAPPRGSPMRPQHFQKQPIIAAPSINRPVIVPPRYFRKPPPTSPVTRRTTEFKTSAPVLPTKVFHSAPAILAQEYNFQSHNDVQVPIKTIKQIGEKGPIHTIPAPNLSLADKPKHIELEKRPIEEVKPRPVEPPTTFVQIQPSHQYQVTEPPHYDPHLLHVINYDQPPISFPILDLPTLVANPANHVEPTQEQYAMDKSSDQEEEPDTAESIVQSQYSTPNHVREEGVANEKSNQTLTNGYYVSLPNQEAAENLAMLQKAGQVNNQLMKKEGGVIFVPEEGEGREDETYDDYGGEDLITEELKTDFGHRIRKE